MSNSNRVSRNGGGGGIGFFGALAILFIGLKLGGVINWSWLWVLWPLWLPLTVLVGILLVCFVVYVSVLGIASVVLAITNTKK